MGENALYRNNGDGTFTDVAAQAGLIPKVAPPYPYWYSGATFVDYDRDGHLDLFVATYTDYDIRRVPKPGANPNCNWKGVPTPCGPRGLRPGRHFLFHNRGDGTFEDVSEKSGIAGSRSSFGFTAVAADFDDDGWQDIYLACDSTPSLFFHNNHDGTFTEQGIERGLALNADGMEQAGMGLAVADFNNDGILDLAIMSQGGDSGSAGDVKLYLGNGDGTFQKALVDVVGGLPVAIALGDFNRDGILDFVTTDYFANTASISLGNGDGTFQSPVPYGVGSGPYYIAAADFNNDHSLDLAVVNDNDNTVSVLLGNGDGTFQAQETYRTGNQVEFVATGDLNLDGNQDLIVANFADKTVGVLLGNGDGTFQNQVTYHVG
ncbi:MAG TPA: VCBS repeat-containing protein, partial [Chloroflexota bacterium]|nr:VCBS repeat-containing protein [Chloroflexota bacterium]